MKIYLASLSTRITPGTRSQYQDFLTSRNLRTRELISFFDAVRGWDKIDAMRPWRDDLMIDSGAFTAWTQKATIDLGAYAAFISAHASEITTAVNLDVIPGQWGYLPTKMDIDKSAEAGWENWKTLSALLAPTGLEPLHVFHQGESLVWLTRLMDEADYIGVSPGNDRSPGEKKAWLDLVWSILTDKQGRPIRKAHGFGVTSLELVSRFPWHSVDSLTWLLAGRYGHVCIPIAGVLAQVAVSTHGTSAHNGRHIRGFSEPEQQAIVQYIQERSFSLDQVATVPLQRDLFNIQAFIELENSKTETFLPPATQQSFI